MNAFDGLLDRDALEQQISEGLISRQKHPTADLYIHNYTAKAAYSRTWTAETLNCRGLILNGEGNIIARPFKKFFNLEDHSRSDILFSKPFVATEKMDGSLGILYNSGGSDIFAVASRGSFVSEQAVRASKILQDRYAYMSWASDQLYEGATPVFEILYPQNRIVCDYKGMEDLVFITCIDNETGADVEATSTWPGPVVQTFDVSCKPREVIEKLGLPDDGSVEGIVLRFDWPKGEHTRVKVKLDEYKRLHRIVTGVSNKTIWEHLRDNRSLDELIDRVPDEFYTWVTKTANELQTAFKAYETAALAEFRILERTIGTEDRRMFANLANQTTPHPALMFCLLDNKIDKFNNYIWKLLQPEFARPFTTDIDT